MLHFKDEFHRLNVSPVIDNPKPCSRVYREELMMHNPWGRTLEVGCHAREGRRQTQGPHAYRFIYRNFMKNFHVGVEHCWFPRARSADTACKQG